MIELIVNILVICLVSVMVLCMYLLWRLPYVSAWHKQWNLFIFQVRVAMIHKHGANILDNLPSYEEMYQSIYGINKMMVHFWKSPSKMIENRELFSQVISLGKEYNVSQGEE